jgi:steroid delta-isomerase-like uncharacterized protein
MSAVNQALVRRFFDEVCNGRKLAVADELFSKTHAYHDPQTPTGPGPQGMRDVIAAYQNAFEGAHWDVEEMISADGDVVLTRWNGTGTHTGELMGIAPTKKRVKVAGIWVHRISAGRIVESWNIWDTLGLLQQLGVVPSSSEEKR